MIVHALIADMVVLVGMLMWYTAQFEFLLDKNLLVV